MIDVSKTEFQTIDLHASVETRIIGRLPLIASVTYSKMKLGYEGDIAAFRRKMVVDVKRGIWASAYHDLIGPIKELQAKALYHAKEEADVRAVRDINERIDALLEYPK